MCNLEGLPYSVTPLKKAEQSEHKIKNKNSKIFILNYISKKSFVVLLVQ